MRTAYWWAVAGIVMLFLSAVVRLGNRGVATMRAGLETGEWTALVLLTAAFVYGEGIRGLARAWIPGALERAAALRAEPPILRVLAPLYAIGLVAPAARDTVRPWAGVAAIVAAIVVISRLPEPWRGVIDFAVAAALAWGIAAIVWQAPRHARAPRSGTG